MSPMGQVLPQVQALLEQLSAQPSSPLSAMPVSRARAQFRELVNALDLPPPPVPVQSRAIAGVPCRIYRPEHATTGDVFVFHHGGGFVIGDLQSADSLAATISASLAMLTVSVEYRLAPEERFPAAHEDCHAVMGAILADRADLGHCSRVLVGGDSAGGTLAACIAQHYRERLAGQLLLYPGTDLTATGGSLQEFAHGFMLELEDINWFAGHFVPRHADLRDPRLSPLYGDLTRLPPAAIVTADLDPLRDQGIAYADALRASGTRVEHLNIEGMVHGCFNMRGALPAAQVVLLRALAALKRLAQIS